MLVRVHRKNVSDPWQIFRSLIECNRRQLENLGFVRRDIFSGGAEVHGGFQTGFLHGQAIIVFVSACLRVRQQDDVVRVADGRVICGWTAHIDHVSGAGCELVGLDHRDVFERARLSIADEAVRLERAGEIRPV